MVRQFATEPTECTGMEEVNATYVRHSSSVLISERESDLYTTDTESAQEDLARTSRQSTGSNTQPGGHLTSTIINPPAHSKIAPVSLKPEDVVLGSQCDYPEFLRMRWDYLLLSTHDTIAISYLEVLKKQGSAGQHEHMLTMYRLFQLDQTSISRGRDLWHYIIHQADIYNVGVLSSKTAAMDFLERIAPPEDSNAISQFGVTNDGQSSMWWDALQEYLYILRYIYTAPTILFVYVLRHLNDVLFRRLLVSGHTNISDVCLHVDDIHMACATLLANYEKSGTIVFVQPCDYEWFGYVVDPNGWSVQSQPSRLKRLPRPTANIVSQTGRALLVTWKPKGFRLGAEVMKKPPAEEDLCTKVGEMFPSHCI